MTCRAWTLKEFDRTALKELTAAIAEQNTEELEQNALDDEPWSEQKYAATLAAQQKEAGLLAGVLAARGITDPAEALTLLAGEEELSDPMLLTDMDKACARILEAIDKEQTIVVYGDYDVDGVTATAWGRVSWGRWWSVTMRSTPSEAAKSGASSAEMPLSTVTMS